MSTMPYPNPSIPAWNFSPAILAIWLVGFMPLESAPIWIPAAQIHYGVGPVAVGIVASMQFVMAALTATFIAPRLARRPLRVPLAIAMAMIMVSAAATAALHLGFSEFVALRILEATGSGLCISGGAMLASRTPKPSRSFGAMQFGQITTNIVIYGLSTRLVITYGLTGLYGMLVIGMSVFLLVVLFSKGWGAAMLERPKNAPGTPSLRITIASISIAVVYCGFVALVANASALGGRAGIGFAAVTMVLAISTPASAFGAFLATVLAGQVRALYLIAAAAAGTAGFGLVLVLAGTSFGSLTVALCGVLMFIYVGVPSIYSGIAALDVTGRAAALTQATQMLGPVLGPAAGAIIAAHSVTAFAGVSVLLIVTGIVMAAIAIWPSLKRETRPRRVETENDAATVRRAA